jgi:hypothetical protein
VSDVLDELLPEPSHRTRYETSVAAPPAAVWAAIQEVTPAELPLTRVLTTVRALPAAMLRRPSAGADDANRPLVEQFLASGFGVLHEQAPWALAVGASGRPWRVWEGRHAAGAPHAAGHVRMVMAFELQAQGAGTRLATETRVRPVDAAAARAFARYWRLIRPGSALIRLDLLRAIRQRAERASAAPQEAYTL